MFTRKHYYKIAEILNEVEDIEKRAKLATVIADSFKEDNPRFNYKRFGDAIDCKFYMTGYIPKK